MLPPATSHLPILAGQAGRDICSRRGALHPNKPLDAPAGYIWVKYNCTLFRTKSPDFTVARLSSQAVLSTRTEAVIRMEKYIRMAKYS